MTNSEYKKWPIGFKFKYISPYNTNNDFDRVVKSILKPESLDFNYEVYLENKKLDISIMSSTGVTYRLNSIEIESPIKYLRNERLNKLGL